jgi:hypothetical protein
MRKNSTLVSNLEDLSKDFITLMTGKDDIIIAYS